MIWTAQQEAAMKAVSAWLKNPRREPIFRLFGYAGTGKTTCAKTIAEDAPGTALFAAYTGKAASVLRSKGCIGARTIHSLIYIPKEKCRQNLRDLQSSMDLHIAGNPRLDRFELEKLEERIAEESRNLARPAFSLNEDSELKTANLIIIDECSMADERLGTDLLSYGVPILALGDPAQLPPVFGGGFFTDAKPDFMLTDIQRQARDNPILRLATAVREGGRLQLGQYGESKVVRGVVTEDVLAADQVLVGRNATRRAYNRRIRQCLARTGIVQNDDRLICLRNDKNTGLLNGSMWKVEKNDYDASRSDAEMVRLTLRGDDEQEVEVDAWLDVFTNTETGSVPYWERSAAQEFDMAYAVTVHKYQGSQANNVLLVDESSSFRDNARRWLYTGITRAAEKLTVVLP